MIYDNNDIRKLLKELQDMADRWEKDCLNGWDDKYEAIEDLEDWIKKTEELLKV